MIRITVEKVDNNSDRRTLTLLQQEIEDDGNFNLLAVIAVINGINEDSFKSKLTIEPQPTT